MLGLWFVLQWFYSVGTGVTGGADVAYLAHVGFVTGVLVGLLVGKPRPQHAAPLAAVRISAVAVRAIANEPQTGWSGRPVAMTVAITGVAESEWAAFLRADELADTTPRGGTGLDRGSSSRTG